jgi:branched-chain amino acid transport system ATP-binding protein
MTALLEIRNLRAWYGASQVLHGVDLLVNAGEIVALGGRNGSGRSTLAKAIVGLVRTEGTIRFAGDTVAGLRTFEIARRGIGYVAEARDVFPALTVAENLQLGVLPAARGRRRARSLAIDDAYARFPILGERLATRAGALSGGEQQMLALARALVGGPDLLVVDEPAEGLAPQVVAQVAQTLRDFRERGMAVLLIEQRFEIAREIASRVAVMGRGRIEFEGTLDALDERVLARWIAPGADGG